MSLIRSGQTEQLSHIRPLAVRRLGDGADGPSVERAPADPEKALLQAEVERLMRSLDTLTLELQAAPEKERAAYERGQKDGYAQGLAAAEDLQSERLSTLTQTADAAIARLSEDWASLERLAGELTVAALDRILGDTARFAALSKSIIQAQLTALAHERVVQIEVSREDFADDEALSTLGAPRSLKLVALDNLPTGSCRVRLTLGAIDVGPVLQWSSLRPLLAAWAQGAEL